MMHVGGTFRLTHTSRAIKGNTLAQTDFDIVVVGGGVNGAGIARDAAGRGYSVCLVEQNDFGGATSASSTKLIHGGLRYLEHYAFRLVRESLQERAVLQRSAPHIIWPLRFVLPHHKGLRPAWLIRLGLFLYDHIGGKQLVPKSTGVRLHQHPAGQLLKKTFHKGFIYSDCWVEDSRLVILNVMDAEAKGATVKNRTKLVAAQPDNAGWHLDLENAAGAKQSISCRMLVNAAGPWAMDVLQRSGKAKNKADLRLIKGSHLIFDRKMPSDDAFLLQNTDGRITFLIPYEGRFTLVGTTDVDVSDTPGPMDISEDEITYLLDMVNPYLDKPFGRDEIYSSYAGVRPLYDDGSDNAAKANRDYHLDVSYQAGAPLLSIFGGKLTTYRRLAESALERINSVFGTPKKQWTAGAVLPGGDFDNQTGLANILTAQISDMGQDVALRLARAYGTKAQVIIADATSMLDLGKQFGYGLSEAELKYLVAHEYATTAEDVLWRRSKLQLHLTSAQIQEVEAWFEQNARASG